MRICVIHSMFTMVIFFSLTKGSNYHFQSETRPCRPACFSVSNPNLYQCDGLEVPSLPWPQRAAICQCEPSVNAISKAVKHVQRVPPIGMIERRHLTYCIEIGRITQRYGSRSFVN
eukprot:830414_1